MTLAATAHTLVLRDQWGCDARIATRDLKAGDLMCGASFDYATCILAPGHDGDHLNIMDQRWPRPAPPVRCARCDGLHIFPVRRP